MVSPFRFVNSKYFWELIIVIIIIIIIIVIIIIIIIIIIIMFQGRREEEVLSQSRTESFGSQELSSVLLLSWITLF